MADASKLVSAISESLRLRTLSHPEPPYLTEDLDRVGVLNLEAEEEGRCRGSMSNAKAQMSNSPREIAGMIWVDSEVPFRFV